MALGAAALALAPVLPSSVAATPGRGRVARSPRRPGPGSSSASPGRVAAPAPVVVAAAPLARDAAAAAWSSPRRRRLGVGLRGRGRRHGLADGHDVVLLRVHVHAVGVARVGRQVELGGTAVVTRGRRDHHRDRGRRDGDEAADAPGTGRGVELHRWPRSGWGLDRGPGPESGRWGAKCGSANCGRAPEPKLGSGRSRDARRSGERAARVVRVVLSFRRAVGAA